jgi:hypothetical protein
MLLDRLWTGVRRAVGEGRIASSFLTGGSLLANRGDQNSGRSSPPSEYVRKSLAILSPFGEVLTCRRISV